MDKNHDYGDNFLTWKTYVDRMGISYPHYAGITLRLVHRLPVVWKTYPPPLWITLASPDAINCCQSNTPDYRRISSITFDWSNTGSKNSNALLHIFHRLSTILPDLSTFWARSLLFWASRFFYPSLLEFEALSNYVDNVENLSTEIVEKRLISC